MHVCGEPVSECGGTVGHPWPRGAMSTGAGELAGGEETGSLGTAVGQGQRPEDAPPKSRFNNHCSERLGLRGDKRELAPNPEPTWASPRIQLPPKGTLLPVMSLCSQRHQVAQERAPQSLLPPPVHARGAPGRAALGISEARSACPQPEA